jgi:hypothetical protein
MIALTIASLVIGGAALASMNFALQWVVAADLVEAEHNVRVAAELIHRDMRTAGYGLHELTTPLAAWIPGVTNRVMVRQGTTAADPDELVLVGARSVSGGQLQFPANVNDVAITLQSGGGAHFNTTTSNLVVVGRMELARVVAVSGDVLTVSKDPSLAGVGLSDPHPALSPVELVTYTTYECVNTNLTATAGQPYLARYQNSATLPSSVLSSICGLGIEDLQVVEVADGSYRITLAGRSSRVDPHFTHPVAGDHYRRYSLETIIQSMN